jgi:hypothetical protein
MKFTATIKGISTIDCHENYKPLNVSGLSEGIKDTQICAVGEKKSKGIAADTCPGEFTQD